jgi:hypothetical protein
MKTFLLIAISILASMAVYSQSSGPLRGHSFTNLTLAGSDKPWLNASNANSSDNSYASFNDLSNQNGKYTDYLVAANFGFNIPALAEITGIAVSIERADPSTSTADHSIRIVKNNIVSGSEHSTGAMYSSTENFEIFDSQEGFGNSTDLWGETWTPADINSTGFGVAVSAKRAIENSNTDGRIDDIRITVYYTLNFTLPVKLTSFSAIPKNDEVRLSWTTEQEEDMDRFEVQRSANGTDFTSFGTIICRNLPTASAYGFNDYSPFKGGTSYRLKIIERNGNINYSKIVTVQFKTNNTATLYPSPWKKGSALFISNTTNEKLTIHFYNSTGENIGTCTSNGNQVPTLPFATGVVRYKVYNAKNEVKGSGTLLIH